MSGNIQILKQINVYDPKDLNKGYVLYVNEKDPLNTNTIGNSSVPFISYGDANFSDIHLNPPINDSKLINERIYNAEVITDNRNYVNYILNPLPNYNELGNDIIIETSTQSLSQNATLEVIDKSI
ncbi:hypothetical protein BCR36DRAFT_584225, partial [Piromyces finnis]